MSSNRQNNKHYYVSRVLASARSFVRGFLGDNPQNVFGGAMPKSSSEQKSRHNRKDSQLPNRTNNKRKRRSEEDFMEELSSASDADDTLSTPASVSPPHSDVGEEGQCLHKERQRQLLLNQVGRKKRPKLGRKYAIGDEVSKHFPVDGWYDGKIIKCYWSNEELQFVYKVKYEGRAKTEAMTEIQLAEIIKNEEDESLYTYEEFNALWEKLDPETIEKSAAIRRANGCFEIKETGTKYNAQYGRMLPGSTDMIFQLMQLHRDDIFLDIGAGIGNSCLQAAYTRGCEARGIEVIENRYEMGLQFKENLEALAHKRDMLDGKIRHVGNIKFLKGDLSDPKIHNWIVKSSKVFVNNFNGVFAERSSQISTEWNLDHYVAGLFASMAPGTIMVTLTDLNLGPTRMEANKWREENGLKPSLNASFFEVRKVKLGEAGQVFSWSTSCKTPAYAYVYKRVEQEPDRREATIMCTSKHCKEAEKGTPIAATSINQLGKVVLATCECKMGLRSNRRIPVADFLEFVNANDFV